jgi:hypothetical protein
VYSGDMYTELKLHCGVLNFEKLEWGWDITLFKTWNF